MKIRIRILFSAALALAAARLLGAEFDVRSFGADLHVALLGLKKSFSA